MPVFTGSYESRVAPEINQHRVEVPMNNSWESESQEAPIDVAIPTLPTPVITPQPTQLPTTSNDDAIISANDDDLIEKEWVDKAKKIIADTRDDPYRREREISKLQIEYIRRRYGREIGDANE